MKTNNVKETTKERKDADADKEKGTNDKESKERRDNDLSEKSKASFVFHHIMLSFTHTMLTN